MRSIVLAGLVSTGLAAMMAGAAAQQPAQGQPPAAGGARGNFGANFTGKIEVGDSTNMRMSRVRFEAGSRTLPFVVLLFIPVALRLPTLFEWARPDAAENAIILPSAENAARDSSAGCVVSR